MNTNRKDFNMIVSIIELIARIIILILSGLDPSKATGSVASISGVEFKELWSRLPNKYKKA